MKTATLADQHIEIRFPFDVTTLDVVRGLPDRKYNGEKRFWTVPATSFHAQHVMATLGRDASWQIEEAVRKLAQQKAVAPKVHLDTRLFKFQKEGVLFLAATNGRAILGDDMGLGKTPQTLAFIQAFDLRRTLVVAPSNVTYKWVEEAGKWTQKTAAVVDDSRSPIPGADIVIISYDLMRIRHEELINGLFDLVVFDECHRLKNHKSQRTRAAKKMLTDGAVRRMVFLSGTPFLNRPMELFPILNLLNPLEFSSAFSYAQRYCGMIYEGGHWYMPPHPVVSNPSELAQRLSKYMLRRTKGQVLEDLPDKTRTIIPINIPNLSVYKSNERIFKKWHDENSAANQQTVLTQLTAMRHAVGIGKVEATVTLAQDILDSSKQVVIYCHHKDVVASIKAGLERKTHAEESSIAAIVKVITGETPAKERQEVVRQFQDGIANVVIMTSAGSEGIDLFKASDIIFAEREWTPAVEEQAEDRLHRNGQKNPVTCWYITALHTIDERLARTIENKRKIIGAVLDKDEIVTEILENL